MPRWDIKIASIVLKVGPFLVTFFFIFVFSIQFIIQLKFSKQNCHRLDSNRGSLASEATALPTAPQPLPNCFISLFIFLLKKVLDILGFFL